MHGLAGQSYNGSGQFNKDAASSLAVKQCTYIFNDELHHIYLMKAFQYVSNIYSAEAIQALVH